jgi:uncharacterized protein YxeA
LNEIEEVLEGEIFVVEAQIGDDGIVLTYSEKALQGADGKAGKLAEVIFIPADTDLRREAYLDIQHKLQWLVSDYQEEVFSGR